MAAPLRPSNSTRLPSAFRGSHLTARSIGQRTRKGVEFRASCSIEETGSLEGDFRLELNRSRLTINSFVVGRNFSSTTYQRCGDPNAPGSTPMYYEIRPQTDYFGGDLAEYRRMDQYQCELFCSADDRCVGYSYVESQKWCSLKSVLG